MKTEKKVWRGKFFFLSPPAGSGMRKVQKTVGELGCLLLRGIRCEFRPGGKGKESTHRPPLARKETIRGRKKHLTKE